MFVVFLTGMVDVLFSAPNILPTIIFGFVISYWLLVILGALDISSLDIEVDFDVEADIEIDYEADLASTGEHDISFLNNVLRFFNLKDLPLMFFLTFWIFPTLFATVIVIQQFGISSFFTSLAIFLPIGFVSLFISKFTTLPFVKMFKALEDESESALDLLGRVVTIKFPISETIIGQAEAFENGSSLLLNVKTKNGAMQKGDQAMIIKYISKNDCYLVEPHHSIY
jgi:hypothetical protein